MAISIEEYDKLCEAEKYFHTIYDSWRSFFSIEKRIDGKWYLFHRLTSGEYHAGCGTKSEDYGSYSSKEAAQYDKEQMMRQHAGLPHDAKLGDPMTFISVLHDNVDYKELNKKKTYFQETK